jgi:hypothetical protein
MKEELFDFIVSLNHEYSKPIKWFGLTRAEFEAKKLQLKEEKIHLQIIATIKLK